MKGGGRNTPRKTLTGILQTVRTPTEVTDGERRGPGELPHKAVTSEGTRKNSPKKVAQRQTRLTRRKKKTGKGSEEGGKQISCVKDVSQRQPRKQRRYEYKKNVRRQGPPGVRGVWGPKAIHLNERRQGERGVKLEEKTEKKKNEENWPKPPTSAKLNQSIPPNEKTGKKQGDGRNWKKGSKRKGGEGNLSEEH